MAETNLGNTQYFRATPEQTVEVEEIIHLVYVAMEEKGVSSMVSVSLENYKE